jgi:hypothetical protein
MYASIVGSFSLATASMAVPRVAFFASWMTSERVSPGVGGKARSSSCAFWRRIHTLPHHRLRMASCAPICQDLALPHPKKSVNMRSLKVLNFLTRSSNSSCIKRFGGSVIICVNGVSGYMFSPTV